MQLTQSHPIRLAIVNLSNYYDEVHHWWQQLVSILASHGLVSISKCPHPYDNEGRGLVTLGEETCPEVSLPSQVTYTYYRIQNGCWEIFCYVTREPTRSTPHPNRIIEDYNAWTL